MFGYLIIVIAHMVRMKTIHFYFKQKRTQQKTIMNWLIKLLSIVIGLSIAHNLQAQHHSNAWFRATLSIPFTNKIKIDNEWQHRRQNGFENKNMLDKNLMFTFRNWIHYQHNKDLKFSLSPFTYFSHYRIIQNKLDEKAHASNEIRFSAAAEWQHKFFERFYIMYRTAMEHRIFNTQQDITRFRNRVGLRYDLTAKMKFSIYDELLLNITGNPFLDHNRLGINLEYKLMPHLKFDMGYIHIVRMPKTSLNKLQENNVFLNLTYQLPKHTTKVRTDN